MKSLLLPLMATILASSMMDAEGSGKNNNVCEEKSCSSWKYAYAECPSNKAYATITLVKKVSRSACVRDNSFGLKETGLWVDNGCRGSFRVCQCSSTDVADCDSWGFKYAKCHLNNPSSIYNVKVVNKRSRSACELGESFGINDEGLWVDKGCRAAFEICRCSSTKVVNCSSWGYKYAECSVLAPRGIIRVTVANKRSKSACVYGKSFGINSKGIWVDKGCRAAFNVCLN